MRVDDSSAFKVNSVQSMEIPAPEFMRADGHSL